MRWRGGVPNSINRRVNGVTGSLAGELFIVELDKNCYIVQEEGGYFEVVGVMGGNKQIPQHHIRKSGRVY